MVDNLIQLILKTEFERRRFRNAKYSLRAFSRDLKFEASAVSKMMRGTRVPSQETVRKLGEILRMDIKSMGQPPPAESGGGIRAESSIAGLTLDTFLTISSWVHFAILELTATRGFKSTTAHAAKRLKVSAQVVTGALERLKNTGLLALGADGVWVDTQKDLTTLGVAVTHAALRKLQTEHLTKAIEALESVSSELRDQSSITMAIDVAKLPEAKERIRTFRRSLMNFLQESDDKSEVYVLSVSLFPVSQ